MQNLKIAVAQMRSGPDAYLNLALVQDFVNQAADRGADLLCLPENLFFRGPKVGAEHRREDSVLSLGSDARLKVNSPFSEALAALIEKPPCALSFGSVYERSSGELPYNSHWIVDKSGIISTYHKIHLFNFESNVGSYREASEMLAGDKPKVVEIAGWRVGLSICFDLRFPELYRHLVLTEKAEVVLVPAAFTRATGEAHWHTLLKARAIENLCYLAAAGQWGDHTDSKGQHLFCYGHSLVISPWGEVLAEAAAEGDALLFAEFSRAEMERRRAQLPALSCVKLV